MENTTNKTEIPSLFSTQEETDTRVILYCKYAQDQGYEYVRIRTPDSDIFFILLHFVLSFTTTILFDTGNRQQEATHQCKQNWQMVLLRNTVQHCWPYIPSHTVIQPVPSEG